MDDFAVELWGRSSDLDVVDADPDLLLELGSFLRGPEGPPGVAGPGAGPVQTLVGVAGAGGLGGHRVVGLLPDGSFGYVSTAVAIDALRAAGITTGSAIAGDAITVQTDGPMTDPSFNWTSGAPIWFNAAGVLTQTQPQQPASVFSEIVAFAVTPTMIFVRLHPPLYIL